MDLIQSFIAEHGVAIVGFTVGAKLVGELLERVGTATKSKHLGAAADVISDTVDQLGRLLTWAGAGNKKR